MTDFLCKNNMEKDKQWHIDQYNRNRNHKDQINDWDKLKDKLTGIVTKDGTKIISYKQS